MVRQARNTTSPVTGAKLDLTDPDRRQRRLAAVQRDALVHRHPRRHDRHREPGPGDGPDGPDRKIVPDSGIPSRVPSACGAAAASYIDNGSIYDGVRGGGRPGQDTGYYEPDGEGDGDGYTPDRARNVAEVRRRTPTSRCATSPACSRPRRSRSRRSASGCRGTRRSATTTRSSRATRATRTSARSAARRPRRRTPASTPSRAAALKPSNLPAGVALDRLHHRTRCRSCRSTSPVIVPPDPRRCFVAKDKPSGAAAPCDTGGWIQQHSRTTGAPVGPRLRAVHAGRQSGEGRPASRAGQPTTATTRSGRSRASASSCSTRSPTSAARRCAPRARSTTRSTAGPRASSTAAEAAGERVLVFSPPHAAHDAVARRPTRPSSRCTTASAWTAWASRHARCGPTRRRTTLEDLWCRHPSVLAHVVGHEHENYVLPPRLRGPGPGPEHVLRGLDRRAHRLAAAVAHDRARRRRRAS